jgi:hypothetical protein
VRAGARANQTAGNFVVQRKSTVEDVTRRASALSFFHSLTLDFDVDAAEIELEYSSIHQAPASIYIHLHVGIIAFAASHWPPLHSGTGQYKSAGAISLRIYRVVALARGM